MVWRVVQELDRLSGMVGKIHHALEELGASPAAFRAVVRLDLYERKVIPFLWRHTFPPVMQVVHDKIAGLRRASERNIQLPAVFVHQSEWSVFFLAAHIMIRSFVVASGCSATRIFPDIHGGLAVHAQATGLAPVNPLPIFLPDVGEDGIRFWNFFWGFALTTGRSR